MVGKAKALFLFIAAICIAASGKAIAEEKWTTFTKEDGSLIDNAIFSIAVDPFYVWVGMKGGICRFDKGTRTWTRFDPISARFPDLASISTEMVTDGFGGIWAGVVGVGIVRYDASIGRWERAYQFQEQITGLVYDPLENALWVGVAGENGGLFRFDIAKRTLTRVEGLPTKYADGTPNRDVTSIAMDGDYIWVGTTKSGISAGDVGLARYQKSTGKWTGYQYGSDPGITNPRVHAIAVGKDLVWFGTRGNAVFYYDKRTGRFGVPNPIPSEILSVARAAINVNAIAFGGDYLWLTAGDTFWSRGSSRWNGPGGLLRYDTVSGKWDLLTKSDGLVSDVVWKVAVDGRAVWIGSLEDVASGSPKGFGLSLYEPSEDTARPELRISISPDPVGDNAIATVSLSSSEPLKRATVEVFSEGEASPKRVLSLSQGKTAMEWTGSFSTAGLPVGIAKAMAFGQDTSRNWGTCKTNFGIVDTTPPPAPVLDPIQSPQSSPVVAVSGKTEAGALVSIFVNGVLSNSGNAGPDGRFSVKVNLALGTNTIYAIAVDAAGNKSKESQQISVVLDTKGPTFAIQVSPSPAKAVDLSITFIASEKLDTASIKARVTQSGMDPTPIQVSFAGESDGKFRYSSIYTVVPGKDGPATVSIEAKDEAGNPGEGTASFLVDTSPPGKPILDPLPPVVNTRKLKISGLAEPNSTLLIVLNGKESEAGKVSSAGRFSNIDLELEEGNNDIWVKAMDDAGNVGPESDRARVFADTIKPMAQLFGPTSWETGVPIEFDGSGSSDNDEIASYTWDMGDGSPKMAGKKISHVYSSPGKYRVTLIVEDRAGNESDPAYVDVEVKKGAPMKPVLDPLPSIIGMKTVSISGKGDPNSTLILIINGKGMEVGKVSGGGWFSGIKVDLSEGRNTISAKTVDISGVESPISDELIVFVDTTRPIARISGPTSWETGVPIEFDGSGSSDNDEIASYTWDMGDGSPKMAGKKISHVYSSPGKYRVTLIVEDRAGNESDPAYVDVEVKKGAPMKPVLDPLPSIIGMKTVSISGKGDPNSTLILIINGKGMEVGKVSGGGWFSGIKVDLSEGRNTISAKTVDISGVESPISDELIVFVDTTRPIARISGPTSWETGVPIEFDGSGSSDNDEIASYTWDMGDGSPKMAGKKISYMYLIPGRYKVMLIVRDRVGLESDPAVLEVDVKKGPPLPPVLVSSVQSPTNKRDLEISGKVGKDVVKVEVNGSTEGVRLLNGQWTYSGQLKEGENRIYVVAYDAEQRASKPLSLTVVLDTTPPGVPSGLSAKAGKSKVVISWNAVSDADRYFVYRSTSEAGPWERISETKETSLDDVDVRNETTYWYSVSALDSLSNESARSSPVSATPSEKGAVTGKFLDHLGMPVQGVKVVLYLGTTKKGEAESGPDGTFVVKGLQEGKYTVVFEPGEGWITPDKMTVEVFAAFTSSLGDIPLEPVPGSLKGRATGITASGEEIGVANATVEAWYGGKKVMEVKTDGSGSFRFDALVPGRYELRLITGKEWIPVPPKAVDVKAMETTYVDFKLSSAPGRIYGRVLSAKTGNPVPGIKVEAMVGTEVKGMAMTDDSGSFSIKDLPEQRYRLKAGGPGRREAVSPQPPGLIELLAGEEVSHDILMGIPGDFDGNERIDFEDLMIFSVLWNSNDPHADMGPYSGTPPDIVPKGDGKLDMEDLMAFAAMWGWFYGGYARAPISPWAREMEKGLGNGFGAGSALDTISIKAEGVKDLLGVEVEIHCCDPSGISIAPGALMEDGDGFVATFTKLDKSGGGMRAFLIRLAPGASGVDGDGEVMRIAFKKGEKAPVIKRVELRNSRNGIENARISSEVFRGLPPGSYTYLSQNYPNPFSSPTTIEFRLERKGRATLKVYDMMGRHVRTLLEGELQPGIYKLIWDGRDENGIELPSGVYIFVLEADGFKGLRKAVRIKR
jgi:PKD repeat protein